MPLSPFHAKLTCSVLSPPYRFLSPALGLICSNAPFLLSNTASFPVHSEFSRKQGIDHASFLAKKLFSPKLNNSWQISQSPSQASFHLTPPCLGHILGLALTSATDAQQERVLNKLGISSNRVRGVWTGVSLQRYKDLIFALNQAYLANPQTMAIPLFTQFVWQKARDKHDLLAYLLALESHLPDLLLPRGLPQEEFVSNHFSTSDFSSLSLQQASMKLVECSEDSLEFAESLELVAANLSTSTRKPVWKLCKHELPNNSQIYDCVEVVVRELMDLMVYNEEDNTFDLDKLAKFARPEVARFYSHLSLLHTTNKEEEENSKAWFALCQRIPGCKYLVNHEFELFPSLENVYRCVAYLLGFSNAMVGPTTPYTPFAFSQAFHTVYGKELLVEERRELFRAALSEETQRRELATCRLANNAQQCIELTLVQSHRLATAKHTRVGGSEWVTLTRPFHVKKCSAFHPVLSSCFWPAFLQHEFPSQPLLSTPWDRKKNWALDQSFLGAELTVDELSRLNKEFETVFSRVLSQVLKDKVDVEILSWLMDRAPVSKSHSLCMQVANQLAQRPDVWQSPLMRASLQNHFPPVLLHLLEHDWAKVSLRDRVRFSVHLYTKKL